MTQRRTTSTMVDRGDRERGNNDRPGRLGELAKNLKIPLETLRFVGDIQPVQSPPPGIPTVKIPSDLLLDPFKVIPAVDPVEQFHKAEMKLYEEIRRLRVVTPEEKK